MVNQAEKQKLDSLLRKGIITTQEYKKLSENAEKNPYSE